MRVGGEWPAIHWQIIREPAALFVAADGTKQTIRHAGLYTPRLPLISGGDKPNVMPARNSSTGCPFTTAWRYPTSKLRLSFTCQMAPTRPDKVRDCPISSS